MGDTPAQQRWQQLKIRRNRLIHGFLVTKLQVNRTTTTTYNTVVAPDRGPPVYYKIDDHAPAPVISFASQLGVEAAQADRERLEG